MSFLRALKYLNYRLTAYTEHDVHSPFVYRFYMELIVNKSSYKDFEALDGIRKQLLEDETLIEVTDLGAGSRKLHATSRSVSNIARHGIARKKQAEFLYRLVRYFAPETIIELGTSLGLTSLYLAKASATTLYTIEGCPGLAAFSQKRFRESNTNNIISLRGNFNDILPELLSSPGRKDLIYIDGNHSYEPTLKYFEMCLENKHPGTILIFDDIYWSEGMEKAWKEISSHPEVRLSMDFFQFGIVFFRTEQKNKEHFVLKF